MQSFKDSSFPCTTDGLENENFIKPIIKNGCNKSRYNNCGYGNSKAYETGHKRANLFCLNNQNSRNTNIPLKSISKIVTIFCILSGSIFSGTFLGSICLFKLGFRCDYDSETRTKFNNDYGDKPKSYNNWDLDGNLLDTRTSPIVEFTPIGNSFEDEVEIIRWSRNRSSSVQFIKNLSNYDFKRIMSLEFKRRYDLSEYKVDHSCGMRTSLNPIIKMVFSFVFGFVFKQKSMATLYLFCIFNNCGVVSADRRDFSSAIIGVPKENAKISLANENDERVDSNLFCLKLNADSNTLDIKIKDEPYSQLLKTWTKHYTDDCFTLNSGLKVLSVISDNNTNSKEIQISIKGLNENPAISKDNSKKAAELICHVIQDLQKEATNSYHDCLVFANKSPISSLYVNIPDMLKSLKVEFYSKIKDSIIKTVQDCKTIKKTKINFKSKFIRQMIESQAGNSNPLLEHKGIRNPLILFENGEKTIIDCSIIKCKGKVIPKGKKPCIGPVGPVIGRTRRLPQNNCISRNELKETQKNFKEFGNYKTNRWDKFFKIDITEPKPKFIGLGSQIFCVNSTKPNVKFECLIDCSERKLNTSYMINETIFEDLSLKDNLGCYHKETCRLENGKTVVFREERVSNYETELDTICKSPIVLLRSDFEVMNSLSSGLPRTPVIIPGVGLMFLKRVSKITCVKKFLLGVGVRVELNKNVLLNYKPTIEQNKIVTKINLQSKSLSKSDKTNVDNEKILIGECTFSTSKGMISMKKCISKFPGGDDISAKNRINCRKFYDEWDERWWIGTGMVTAIFGLLSTTWVYLQFSKNSYALKFDLRVLNWIYGQGHQSKSPSKGVQFVTDEYLRSHGPNTVCTLICRFENVIFLESKYCWIQLKLIKWFPLLYITTIYPLLVVFELLMSIISLLLHFIINKTSLPICLQWHGFSKAFTNTLEPPVLKMKDGVVKKDIKLSFGWPIKLVLISLILGVTLHFFSIGVPVLVSAGYAGRAINVPVCIDGMCDFAVTIEGTLQLGSTYEVEHRIYDSSKNPIGSIKVSGESTYLESIGTYSFSAQKFSQNFKQSVYGSDQNNDHDGMMNAWKYYSKGLMVSKDGCAGLGYIGCNTKIKGGRESYLKYPLMFRAWSPKGFGWFMSAEFDGHESIATWYTKSEPEGLRWYDLGDLKPKGKLTILMVINDKTLINEEYEIDPLTPYSSVEGLTDGQIKVSITNRGTGSLNGNRIVVHMKNLDEDTPENVRIKQEDFDTPTFLKHVGELLDDEDGLETYNSKLLERVSLGEGPSGSWAHNYFPNEPPIANILKDGSRLQDNLRCRFDLEFGKRSKKSKSVCSMRHLTDKTSCENSDALWGDVKVNYPGSLKLKASSCSYLTLDYEITGRLEFEIKQGEISTLSLIGFDFKVQGCYGEPNSIIINATSDGQESGIFRVMTSGDYLSCGDVIPIRDGVGSTMCTADVKTIKEISILDIKGIEEKKLTNLKIEQCESYVPGTPCFNCDNGSEEGYGDGGLAWWQWALIALGVFLGIIILGWIAYYCMMMAMLSRQPAMEQKPLLPKVTPDPYSDFDQMELKNSTSELTEIKTDNQNSRIISQNPRNANIKNRYFRTSIFDD